MQTKNLISIFLLITLIYSCDTNEPPSPPDGEKPTLELTLEDASCTEAWIELTTTNLQLPTTLTLKQFNPSGDTISQILNLNTQDSLLYIDSLLPNQTYTFLASHSGLSGISSNSLSVTTMDTTNHDFIFETYTFGGNAGSCALYDVARINENNIWAVGEIYVADTSINGYTTYGAVHWDGQVWELKKLFYNTNIPVTPRGIFVINPTEIYLASGSIFRWNGSSSTVQLVYSRLNLPDPNATIEKLWGSSGSSIYGVGNVGTIVHYNGQSWQRIESGTNLNIGDIWGISDGDGGYYKYLAADNAMLIINEYGNLQRVITEQGHTLSSVWGISEKLLYTAGGNGLSLYKNYNWEKINKPDVNTIYNVRGQGHNDVFGLSSTFNLLHFNGYSWQYINIGGSNIYYRQEVKNELTVVVGWQGDKAVITVIRRNQ